MALNDRWAGLYGGGIGWLMSEFVIEAIPCSGEVEDVFSSRLAGPAVPGLPEGDGPPGGGGGGKRPGWCGGANSPTGPANLIPGGDEARFFASSSSALISFFVSEREEGGETDGVPRRDRWWSLASSAW